MKKRPVASRIPWLPLAAILVASVASSGVTYALVHHQAPRPHMHCNDAGCISHEDLQWFIDRQGADTDPHVAAMLRAKLLDQGSDVVWLDAGGAR